MLSWTNKFKSLFHSIDPMLLVSSIAVPANKKLVVTTDSLLEGVHFPLATPAHAVGSKSLAVNLSDLAAMGASPHACNIVLGFPEYNEQWAQQFVEGWAELALKFSVPVCEIKIFRTEQKKEIHVTAFGILNRGEGLYRHTAQIGDLVYVSGTLGEAAAGLELELQLSGTKKNPVALKSITDLQLNALNDNERLLVSRLRYPLPRVELGRALNGIANACLDISDGLHADLGHIAQRSSASARINCNELFLSKALTEYCSKAGNNSALDYALVGGDDYELCFTISPEKESEIMTISKECNIRLTRIGLILDPLSHENTQICGDDIALVNNVKMIDGSGALYCPATKSYQHFD